MSKHTPGPWYVNDAKGARYIETQSDDVIAQVFRDGRGNQAADANLIAAAPELLAFAQEFLADYQSEDGMASMKHYAGKAYAAIAKATGEQS